MTEQLTEQYAEVQEEVHAGPPAPVRISWAPIARVNLLPIEIIESRRFRRTQGALAGVVVAVVLLAGTGTYLAQMKVSDQKDELSASQAKVSVLESEQAKYAAVPQVIAQVDAATAARTSALTTDVLWYRYLSEIDGARPSGLLLNAMTMAMNISSAPVTSTDPLSSTGTGTILIEGTADQYAEVSAWLEAVNKITGFSSATLAKASKDEKGEIAFSMSAVVDTDALSGRYTKDAD